MMGRFFLFREVRPRGDIPGVETKLKFFILKA
jgi:hypothetical protein